MDTGSVIHAVSISPNGQYIVAGGQDRTVTLWDATRSEAEDEEAPLELGIASADGVVISTAFGPRSDMVAAGTNDNKVLLFSVPELTALVELAHDGVVRSLSFSPDGEMLAGGGGTDPYHGLISHSVPNQQLAMKTVVWKVSLEEHQNALLGTILFDDIVHAVAFSPSQNWLAVGGKTGSVALLAVNEKFQKVLELPCLAGVHCLAWSPDSRFIASGGEDMKITIWCLSTRQVAVSLPKSDDWLRQVCFAP